MKSSKNTSKRTTSQQRRITLIIAMQGTLPLVYFIMASIVGFPYIKSVATCDVVLPSDWHTFVGSLIVYPLVSVPISFFLVRPYSDFLKSIFYMGRKCKTNHNRNLAIAAQTWFITVNRKANDLGIELKSNITIGYQVPEPLALLHKGRGRMDKHLYHSFDYNLIWTDSR